MKYVTGTRVESLLDVAVVKHINICVSFQLLRIRVEESEESKEWKIFLLGLFVSVGTACHIATMGFLWEVPSCYRILLPTQIAEFIKYYYKIVS